MSQEGFEEYLAKGDADAAFDALLASLPQGEIPQDPWRHLDGIRRVGQKAMATLTEEDQAQMWNTIHHFVPSVQGMDIDLNDPNQVRAYLVGIGMAWRLAADEFARCQAATPHTFDHLNASLSRMMIAMEPVVLGNGVRPPVDGPEEDDDAQAAS